MRSPLASRPLALVLLPLRLLVLLVFGPPLVLLRLIGGAGTHAGRADASEAVYQAKRNLMYPARRTHVPDAG